MEKFLKISFIVLFFLIYATSCKKDPVELNGDMSLIALNTNYNLVVDDELNPIYEKDRESYTYKSTDENVLTVDNDGKVKAISKGDAEVVVYDKNDIYGRIVFKVKDKDKVNYNYNDELYKELETRFAEYDNSDSFEITLNMNMNGTKSSTRSMMIKSPFYMEYETGTKEDDSFYIIEEINNKIFVSNVNRRTKIITKNVVANDTFNSSDYSLGIDALDEIASFNKEKVELNKLDDNKYEIRFSIGDSLSFSSMLVDEEILDYIKSMKDIIVDTIIEIKNNKIEIDMSINFHIISMNMVFDIPMNINFVYQFNDLEKFDTTNYKIIKQKSFDYITEETDITNGLKLEGYEYYYGYGYFEEGYYSLVGTNDSRHFSFNLYDNDQKVLDIKKYNIYTNDMAFEVKESGYYYFVCGNQINTDNFVTFNKLDYHPQERELESCSGSLVGRYDFVKFHYSSTDENEYIKITNNGNSRIDLYYNYSPYDQEKYLKPGYSIYYNPSGNTIIYLASTSETIDYNIVVESFSNSNGTDYENLDLITQEYDKTYILGEYYKTRKMKLVVEKEGYYHFRYKGFHRETDLNGIYIEGVNSGSSYEYYLDKGVYIIQIPNSWRFDLVQIRYDYYDKNHNKVDVELVFSEFFKSLYPIDNVVKPKAQVDRRCVGLEEDEQNR